MTANSVVDAGRIQPTNAARVRVSGGRSFRRWVTAGCMVIGPIAVAAVRGVIPYRSAGFSDHAGVYPVLATAEVIAVLTMGFAMLGLGRLVQGRAPLFALIGTPVAAVSWTMVAVLGTVDSVTYEMAKTGTLVATDATLLARIQANPEIAFFFGLFLLGHLVGPLLLGIGLLVSRRVPVWAGIALIAGDLLHPVAFVVLGSHALDALCYLVFAAGMAVAARAVLATPNDQWDLAPEVARP
jgi:hypothetical protein